MNSANFIQLKVHTEYSLIDGIVKIDDLVETAILQNTPAVAITDFCNLFAAVKFYQASINVGIKPIFGVDILVVPADGESKQAYLLTLFAQNARGYRNVTELISQAYISGQQQGIPYISEKWLIEKNTDMILLSGGREGDIGQALLAGQYDIALAKAENWSRLFPNRFYIELQRTGHVNDKEYVEKAMQLATELKLPVVATNNVRFIKDEDYEAHEARVCIHRAETLNDSRRQRLYSEQQYFKSPEEMQELFQDIPEAITNSLLIAKRCNVQLDLGKAFLPNFSVPENFTIESYLSNQSETGLKERLQEHLSQNTDSSIENEVYFDRLKTELKVINEMGFAGYFLIVADFIQWAKQHGIPVGPGRGSGAGSLVAYALKITDLDPLPYDLLFERFLNPERVSMPDFDIDFCINGRDRVIEYVAHKYGKNSVSQIITFGTMAAKAVVRDVGRVLGMPYGFVDKIAKLIPFELGITLEKALEQEEELNKRYQEEDDVRTLIDLALKLEGITRNAGKHAGGVVIAPSALTDFTPIYCEQDSDHYVTQFDKDDVEAIGLVKFDFLGLRNLTIIDWTLQSVNQKRQAANLDPILINKIPLDDATTFELLRACQTTAVFQLESRGMKDLIKRLQPDCFEEIIALVALFRPGPLQSGMVDDFINRKHGRAKVEYPHPDLEPILRPTYGIILYQEQVMQIAQVLAGYSLGSADLLRRAMGKKKPEEMAKQRATFIDGAKARGVNPELASSIFDLMEKFAGYGFNKSHSAAYALVSYQTAWLKTHYAAEFMAAVLSSDMQHTDKVVSFISECKTMNLNVLAPDVNTSNFPFTAISEKEILYGLGAVKGVGENAILAMIAERQEKGSFKNLFDFCQRVDLKKMNRRMLDALIRSGSMDKLGPHRASVFATLPAAVQQAEQQASDLHNGQCDLFGMINNSAETIENHTFADIQPWSMSVLLQAEKETLGHYFSGHPLQRFSAEFAALGTVDIANLEPDKSQTVMLGGVIVGVRILQTKRGDRMGFLTVEDQTGRVEIAVFPEIFNENKEILVKDQILMIEGEVSLDEYSGGYRIGCKRIFSIHQIRKLYAKQLLIYVEDSIEPTFLTSLSEAIKPFAGGKCPLMIEYRNQSSLAKIPLGDKWKVELAEPLFEALDQLIGNTGYTVEYK